MLDSVKHLFEFSPAMTCILESKIAKGIESALEAPLGLVTSAILNGLFDMWQVVVSSGKAFMAQAMELLRKMSRSAAQMLEPTTTCHQP